MAFTVSHIVDGGVVGNVRVKYLRVTADAAEGEVLSADSGLRNIFSLAYAPQSMTTASAKIDINKDSSGVASLGAIGISGVASGDEMLLTVWGV